jgi:hypothetical protein
LIFIFHIYSIQFDASSINAQLYLIHKNTGHASAQNMSHYDLNSFFLTPPKKSQPSNDKEENDDPVVYSEYLGQGDLAEISTC